MAVSRASRSSHEDPLALALADDGVQQVLVGVAALLHLAAAVLGKAAVLGGEHRHLGGQVARVLHVQVDEELEPLDDVAAHWPAPSVNFTSVRA